MSKEVKLPSLGEDIESGDVLSVLVQEGDEVEAEQGLIELETEKATVEVPSPEAGRVTKIHVSEGDTIKVGEVIVSLDSKNGKAEEKVEPEEEEETADEAAAAEEEEAEEHTEDEEAAKEEEAEEDKEQAEEPEETRKPKPAKAKPTKTKRTKPAKREESPDEEAEAEEETERVRTPEGDVPGDGHTSAAAGPAVRRLARELGVDLRRVRATGEGGRITREDVQAYVRRAQKKVQKSLSGEASGDFSVDDYGTVRRERMSRMRQTIARNMAESYTTIPQLTNFDDADVTELEKIRQESKADYAQKGIKLTAMPFLIKAVSSALKNHPILNAAVDLENKQIVYKEYINVGVAVDTERGLLVPVIRDADQMSVPQIAHALQSLAEKVRGGDFSMDDLRGGTFTISNLGAIGGTYSTPLINPPEVAVLLAGRARKMPVYIGDELAGRLMLPLSITYDHRVVDGAAAARFLNEVKGLLSSPGRLLLAP